MPTQLYASLCRLDWHSCCPGAGLCSQPCSTMSFEGIGDVAQGLHDYLANHFSTRFLPKRPPLCPFSTKPNWARLKLQSPPGWREWGEIYFLGMQLHSPAVWAAGVPFPFAGTGQWNSEVEQSHFREKQLPEAAAEVANGPADRHITVQLCLLERRVQVSCWHHKTKKPDTLMVLES